MKKFIFLDIDGVLNHTDASVAARMLETKKRHRLHDVDEVKVGLLMWLVEQTSADIVISSTWRMGRTEEWFEGFFEAYGWCNPPIVGCTDTNGRLRGEEINRWLEYNMYRPDNCKYVILDDDSDMLPDQPFVHVPNLHGLTLKHVYQCLDILGIKEEATEDDLKTINGLRKSVEFKREE